MVQRDIPTKKVRCAALTSDERTIYFMRSAEHPNTLYVSRVYLHSSSPNVPFFCLLGVASDILAAKQLPAPDLSRPEMRAARSSNEVGLVTRCVPCAQHNY